MEADGRSNRRRTSQRWRGRLRPRNWVLGLSATVALFLALRFGLWNVVEDWFHKPPSDSQTLWTVPLFWVGRIGKLLQFFGGFVALLDIYGPERLLQLGRTNSQRARKQLRVSELSRVWRRASETKLALVRTLSDDLNIVFKEHSHHPLDTCERCEHRDVPLHSDPRYRKALTTLIDSYGSAPCCEECTYVVETEHVVTEHRTSKWNCKHGNPLYSEVEDDLVRAALNTEERTAQRVFEAKSGVDITALFLWSIMFVNGPVAMGLTAGFLRYRPEIVHGHPVLWGMYALQGLVSLVLQHRLRDAPYLVLLWLDALRWRIASIPPTILGNIMNRPHPDHPLRKVAFMTFVLGFGLDLLAS